MPSIWEGAVPTPYFSAPSSVPSATIESQVYEEMSQSSSAAKPKKRPITRNRESLACTHCRARKLKCDRGQPCGSCVKRDEADSCTYGRTSEGEEVPSRARISQGEARLQHLERLVEDFIHGKSRPPSVSAGPAPALRDDYASMDSQMTENGRFLGSTHYSAMLDDIQELRDILYISGDNYNETTPFDSQNIDEFSVLFGGTPCPTLSVVLSRYLPSRADVDRRVAAYFRSTAINAPYIHVPQFYRQYQAFWSDQLRASPLWISILFSMCQTSKGVTADVVDDPYDRDFSLAAAYCLAIGHYHRPQRFAVESILMYIQCNIISRMDLPRDIGTLVATLIQLAYTMGYHRDPDHFKHVSVFEGEMRRRAWAICLQLDLLISFQLGLPNSVQADSWDTRPLRNLLDTDLDEDVPVLPPGRAPTEPTQAMFYNAKQQLMNGFPKVLKHALSSNRHTTEAELLAVDAELRQSYREIPDALKWRYNAPHAGTTSAAASSSSPPSSVPPLHAVVTSRCIELLYQKCLCILHRKYVTSGRESSIRVCLDAASAIVKAQLEIYPEVQPGRQLAADRWMAFGALTWNDFLLGLMVLCLILRQHRRRPIAGLSPADVEGILLQLQASRVICVEKAAESRECHRIIRLLDAVLADAMPAQPMSAFGFSVPASSSSMASGGEVMTGVESGGSVGDFEGQVWSPLEANVFDGPEWEFLEESFGGFR